MVAINCDNFTKTIRKWLSKFTVIILSLSFLLYIYAIKIEPNWIQVIPINLTIDNLSPAFDSYKIVQISDIHANKFMPESRLKKVIELTNKQNPNAIAITGDFITKYKDFNGRKLIDNLSLLQSQDGIFSVMGNHDLKGDRTRLKKLKTVLQRSNVINLDNRVFIIKRGKEQLAFAGIDDPYWGKPNLQKVIKSLPKNIAAILLVHEPDYIQKSAKTHKFALQLSGHSHGGQIRFPFLDPLILPFGGRKYYAGLNRVEDTLEYTNRGLGMTGLPFRFNSRPEITVFTLNSPS